MQWMFQTWELKTTTPKDEWVDMDAAFFSSSSVSVFTCAAVQSFSVNMYYAWSLRILKTTHTWNSVGSFGTFKSTSPSSNFHRMGTMHEAWGLKTTTGPHPVTLPILSIKRSPSRPQRLNEVIRSESWTDQPLSSQHKKSPWSDNFFIPRH